MSSYFEYLYWKHQFMSINDEKNEDHGMFNDFLLRGNVIDCLKRYSYNDHSIKEHITPGKLFVNKCIEKGYDAIAFDLDFTANRKHSGGVIAREYLNDYCNSPSVDFLVAVVMLVMSGKQVALLSFTDTRYYSHPFKCPKETHIAGEDLIMKFIDTNFTKEISDKIFCYGRNPELHSEPKNKKQHIDVFMFHEGIVDYKKVALFDDSSYNVNDSNVDAYKVDPNSAFVFSDLA